MSVIIGSDSCLARCYIKKCLQKKSTTVATSYRSQNPQLRFDLYEPNFNILDKVIHSNLKYAIIFAGLSRISFCEKEKEYSYRCNVEGVLKTAKYFIKQNIVPIVFSSDHVFNGGEGNYSERSFLHPLNEYGKQKAELEVKMINSWKDKCIIIRLSKVYDIYYKNNFFMEIIDNLKKIKIMRLVYDQIFSPINIEELIDIIFLLQKMNYRGLINISGKENINRFDLAQKIINEYNLMPTFVEKIAIDNLDAIKRPKNITLNNQYLFSILNYELKSMDSYIKQAMVIYDKKK